MIKPTLKTLEAAVGLAKDERWQAILDALKVEREARVQELLAAEQFTEYQRALIVGRVRAIQEFVQFSENAAAALRNWQTK